jgi:hypothetical protein
MLSRERVERRGVDGRIVIALGARARFHAGVHEQPVSSGRDADARSTLLGESAV